MFTGIIQATGTVCKLESRQGDYRLEIESKDLDFSDVGLGDSIAVSGICLTVVGKNENTFVADVSNETVSCTSFKNLQIGQKVNLEKALLPSDRLGGHIVSGHVDGICQVISKTEDGRSIRFVFELQDKLARYVAAKGSVCLDGVSLTVNEVESRSFGVNIIPHTAQMTTFHEFEPGRIVNLEVDLLSRYLERLLGMDENNEKSLMSLQFLQEHGFASK